MSVESFFDELTATTVVTHAAIINFDGDIRAHSPDFFVSANEVKEMISGFADNDSLIANGLYINGDKYTFSEASDSYISGDSNNADCCIYKLSQTFLISICEDKTEYDFCVAVTESIAQSMKRFGY